MRKLLLLLIVCPVLLSGCPQRAGLPVLPNGLYDGRRLDVQLSIQPRGFPGLVVAISPDGKRVAYRYAQNDTLRVMIKDEDQPPVAAGPPISLRPHSADASLLPVLSYVFSPDSRRFAYAEYAPMTGTYRAVVDGQPGPQFTLVTHLTFSPDSRHLAYCARGTGSSRDAMGYVILDGEELCCGAGLMVFRQHGGPSPLVFSPDSRHLAFPGKQTVMFPRLYVDGRPIGTQYVLQTPVWSGDSKHVATVTASNENGKVYHRAFIDDRPQKLCQEIIPSSLHFSPDSRRLAYVAWQGDKMLAVADGVDGPPRDLILPQSLTWLDDGRLAYVAGASDSGGPKGRQMTFTAFNGQRREIPFCRYLVVTGDQEDGDRVQVERMLLARGEASPFLVEAMAEAQKNMPVDAHLSVHCETDGRPFLLSPDKRHGVAVINVRDNKGPVMLVIDGTAMRLAIPGRVQQVVFESPDTLLMLTGDHRVRARLVAKELPAAQSPAPAPPVAVNSGGGLVTIYFGKLDQVLAASSRMTLPRAAIPSPVSLAQMRQRLTARVDELKWQVAAILGDRETAIRLRHPAGPQDLLEVLAIVQLAHNDRPSRARLAAEMRHVAQDIQGVTNDERWTALCRVARACCLAGELDQADQVLARLNDKEKDRQIFWTSRAWACLAQGNHEGALVSAARLPALRRVDLLLELASALLDRGQIQQAGQVVLEALKLRPEVVHAADDSSLEDAAFPYLVRCGRFSEALAHAASLPQPLRHRLMTPLLLCQVYLGRREEALKTAEANHVPLLAATLQIEAAQKEAAAANLRRVLNVVTPLGESSPRAQRSRLLAEVARLQYHCDQTAASSTLARARQLLSSDNPVTAEELAIVEIESLGQPISADKESAARAMLARLATQGYKRAHGILLARLVATKPPGYAPREEVEQFFDAARSDPLVCLEAVRARARAGDIPAALRLAEQLKLTLDQEMLVMTELVRLGKGPELIQARRAVGAARRLGLEAGLLVLGQEEDFRTAFQRIPAGCSKEDRLSRMGKLTLMAARRGMGKLVIQSYVAPLEVGVLDRVCQALTAAGQGEQIDALLEADLARLGALDSAPSRKVARRAAVLEMLCRHGRADRLHWLVVRMGSSPIGYLESWTPQLGPSPGATFARMFVRIGDLHGVLQWAPRAFEADAVLAAVAEAVCEPVLAPLAKAELPPWAAAFPARAGDDPPHELDLVYRAAKCGEMEIPEARF